MTQKEFQQKLVKFLRTKTTNEIASIADVSIPTVERWIMGTSSPVSFLKDRVIQWLKEETYSKYQ